MSNELFVLERTFNAPRELVYNAWTNADSLAQWWGPKGFQIEVVKLDLRPGGMFHYCMQAPDGNKIWGKFVYREINAPAGMVFVNSFSDAAGNTTANPWMPEWPLEILNTLTLYEEGDKTRLTLKGSPINATEEQHIMYKNMTGSMQEGFKGTFEQLDEYLAKMA